MRSRAHFFLQEKHESDIGREDFEFKSKSTPPQCKHMEALKKEFLGMITNINFRSVKARRFQKSGHSKNKSVTKSFCFPR